MLRDAKHSSSEQFNPRLVLAVVGLVALAIIGFLIAVMVITADESRRGAGGEDGVLGGNFLLESNYGDVALSDYRGNVVVLYFGFMSCPEVCPTSMSMIGRTLENLNDEELEKVQPILVSIDPARDSPYELSKFVKHFHPKIIGVTGTTEEVDALARNYGAFFSAVETRDPDDYVFDHTSRYFVINKQGELVDAMRHSTTANELTARIRTLL
ncbi:MAG: SCO family protein [Pseudomonadota bacterium]